MPINLFIDSLLQYYALAQVIVNIQEKSYVRWIEGQQRFMEGKYHCHEFSYFDIKKDVSQVHFDVSSHMLIAVTKIIGPLSACVVPQMLVLTPAREGSVAS